MADFSLDFDTPQSSSQRSVRITGTVPGDHTQGYARISVTVTNATRTNHYYKTFAIDPTGTEYPFHGTYNLAIVPKILAGDTTTATYAFSFTAQQ